MGLSTGLACAATTPVDGRSGGCQVRTGDRTVIRVNGSARRRDARAPAQHDDRHPRAGRRGRARARRGDLAAGLAGSPQRTAAADSGAAGGKRPIVGVRLAGASRRARPSPRAEWGDGHGVSAPARLVRDAGWRGPGRPARERARAIRARRRRASISVAGGRVTAAGRAGADGKEVAGKPGQRISGPRAIRTYELVARSLG